MDRYAYTPNLLLNKRLTPPFSPSGRNLSLHPRIISHISRYTKERERGRKKERKEERKGLKGEVDWVKMYGVTAQCSWETKVSGGAMRGKTEIRGSYAAEHTCRKTNTHTKLRRHTHSNEKVRLRTYLMKTCKD